MLPINYPIRQSTKRLRKDVVFKVVSIEMYKNNLSDSRLRPPLDYGNLAMGNSTDLRPKSDLRAYLSLKSAHGSSIKQFQTTPLYIICVLTRNELIQY